MNNQEQIHLYSLDKKLMTIQHRLSNDETLVLEKQHNLTKEQLVSEVQRQLYNGFMAAIINNIPITINKEEDSTTYTLRGYALNERQMLETILEVADMEDIMKEKMVVKIKTILGITI